MSAEIASRLYESARSHALSADLLYRSALQYAVENNIKDPELFAFNGTHSLSIHYLIGLGIELYLKAIYVMLGGQADNSHLRSAIGHDLGAGLDLTEGLGFTTNAPNFREIVLHLRESHLSHFFRYDRPPNFELPDIRQTIEAIAVLDEELAAKLRPTH